MGGTISWALQTWLGAREDDEDGSRQLAYDDMLEHEILPVYEAPMEHAKSTKPTEQSSPMHVATTAHLQPPSRPKVVENSQQEEHELQSANRSPTVVSNENKQPLHPQQAQQQQPLVPVITQSPELRKMWFEPEWTGFRVRSKNYLLDHAKIPTKEPLLELLWFDLFCGEHQELLHICRHRDSFVQKALAQPNHDLPHILALSLLIPGSPVVACVQYFALKKDLAQTEATNEAMKLYEAFLQNDNAFRSHRFKLIPSVLEGPWVAKKSVGNKPVILGNALQLQQFATPQYLEICIDVSSDRVAKHVTSLCRTMSTKIQIAMAFVIEGQESSELPERVLGCVAYDHVDLSQAIPLQQ